MKLQFDEDCLYLLKEYSIRKNKKYDLIVNDDLIREFNISNKKLIKAMCNTKLRFKETNKVYSLKELANYMEIDFNKFINRIVDGKYIKPRGPAQSKKNVYYYSIKEITNEHGKNVKVQVINEITDSFSESIFMAIVSFRKELKGFNKKLYITGVSLTTCLMLAVFNFINILPLRMLDVFKISMYNKNKLLYISMGILFIMVIILYILSNNIRKCSSRDDKE